MQTILSRLGAVRCLFFKSEQFQLIDMPVRVGASVDKHGHVRPAFTRVQKVRVEKPKQDDMFGGAEPTKAEKHSARLDAFIRKHGGMSRLAHLMQGMTEEQRNHLHAEMGKLCGKTADEVASMLSSAKPEASDQADMFAQPVATVKESLKVAGEDKAVLLTELREKNSTLADRAMEAGNGKLSGNIRGFTIGMKDTDSNLSRKWVDEVVSEYEKLVVSSEKLRAKNEKPEADDDQSQKEGSHKTENGVDYVLRDGRWHNDAATPEKLDLPVIEHDGDTWYVLSTGAAGDDGKVLAHLSSTTRGTKAANGVHPFQINDYIDRATLGMVEKPEHEIVEYTTRKGKVLRGIVRTDLTHEEAKAIDEYTFKYEGGYFIREKHLDAMTTTPKTAESAPVVAAQVDLEARQRKIESHKGPIESSDPLAVAKLAHKVEQLEKRQATMKAANKAVKSGNDVKLAEMGFSPEAIAKLKTKDFAGRIGFPDYEITNNGSEIRRAKKRMAELMTQNQEADIVAEESKIEPVIAENLQSPVENEAESRYQRLLARRTDGSHEAIEAEDSRLDALASEQHAPESVVGNIEPFGVSAGISKQARRDLNAQGAAIVARGGPFSDDDKAILRQYSGNGGCGDSLNEFYTLPEVAASMWAVAQRLGVKGDVLEPSCGPGVFLHTAPADSKVVGVEWDKVSADIATALHGDHHEVANASLERFSTQDTRQFDGVLGNVPFGLRGGLIKDDKPGLKTADAYFFDTSMDKCKAGGIVGLIVPTGIMDSRTNRKLREALSCKGQFLGAQRMPNTAFEHSHTGVTTDVVWFRKFPDDVAGALSTAAVSQDHMKALGVWDDEFIAGNYFAGRGASNVLGKMEAGWRAKAGMGSDITVEGSMKGVPEALNEFQAEEAKTIPSVTDILAAVGDDEKSRAAVLGGAMKRPYADKSKAGDTKTVDGIAYVLQGKPPRWHRIDEVLQSEALTQGQDIAARIDALIAGATDIDRSKLESDLRAWVEEHGIPSKNKDILLGSRMDKTLHRLIGAVKSNGDLSDLVMGKVAVQVKGSFEATIQSLLNDHETVGVDALAKAASMDADEALDQLYGSSKYAVDAVTGEWTTKDIYLSGDLWAKLDATKNALELEGVAPELRKKLEQQAVMLTDAIAPVSLEDAFIEMNSAFIPTAVLSAFLDEKAVNAGYKKWHPEDVEVNFGEGVYTAKGGFPHQDSFLKYMNRNGLRKDDKPAIDEMNIEFKDWLCASPEFRDQIEELYNRKFMGFQEREFSNEPMDIPGMNTEGLKDYQWGTLRWALNAGKGIIASDVGLGKTVCGLMLAKTMKATGQSKRPMIVCPKSVLSNWVAECEKWFPGSKVLAIGLKGDTEAKRNQKLHDMQQNDYDFILCSEPAFEAIDLNPIIKGEINSKDFWNQRGAKLDKATSKQQEKIRTQWEQALAQQEFGDDRRTRAAYFDEIGVDAVIADEMHHQKNLVALRSRFGETPKYMGGSGLSSRALDFNMKSRWLLGENGGKNVFGLTATPIKNSPLEIYAMMSHVAPELMENIGIRNSEEFIDRFAKLEQGMAITTSGVMEEATITAGFKNMEELRTAMKRCIRRKTADDVGLKLPTRQDVTHMIDMDDAQEAKYVELREQALESGGKDATGDSHIFSIMDKMNKTAADLGLLDDSYDSTKSPKYVECAKTIVQNMKDGGQIVFSDYNDSHEKIADALVAAGIPRNQIGILNGAKTPSSEQRQKMCDQFNDGVLKVVIGNTTVMGEGLNLQNGTADIHHLDLPWEPASMQQRNGRGLRQGNTNLGVRIHSYLAKGSFDGYRLQSILGKKDVQDMIWNGGNDVENLNRKGNISRDEMMIMLAADPDQARAAYESNNKEKEERLVAGKTTDAAARFSKFQELKRSYLALPSKTTQSAARLKEKMDKEQSVLRADKYFSAKQALDVDTPVIVAKTGDMLFAGAGIALGTDDAAQRYVVTGVDPRKQTVTLRGYAGTDGLKRTVELKDLYADKIVPFAFDAAAETEEINRKIADQPLEIKTLRDVNKLPAAAISANYDKLQSQLWEGFKNYSISAAYGQKVPLINKATGKLALTESYNISGAVSGAKEFTPDTYDFLLPIDEHKAKLHEAWKDAERSATFGTKYSTTGNRRNQTSVRAAVRNYDGNQSNDSGNPWARVVDDMSGAFEGNSYHYGGGDSKVVGPLREKFNAEQINRVRHAKTFSEALDAAAPLGEIHDKEKGDSAVVKLPESVIALLWAKAKHDGVLGAKMQDHLPTMTRHAYASAKHSGYYLKDRGRTVHSTLLGMAANSGHDDLVHAMVESGIRHKVDDTQTNHIDAIQALAQGYDHKPARIRAMQKLADAADLSGKPRGVLQNMSGDFGVLGTRNYYLTDADKQATIGDKLGELLTASEAKHNKVGA